MLTHLEEDARDDEGRAKAGEKRATTIKTKAKGAINGIKGEGNSG